MKNPFLKRLIKEKTSDVVHSSAYARTQGGGMGASSAESFSRRRSIDQNRQVVRGYGDSRLVNDARGTIHRGTTKEARKAAEARVKSRIEEKNKDSKQSLRDKFGGQRVEGKKEASVPPVRKNPGIFR